MTNNTLKISAETKQRMIEFFLKTSIPRILEKEKERLQRKDTGKEDSQKESACI